MTDFMLLLPLLIVGIGAILLMLLSVVENVESGTAGYVSMAIFGLAFIAGLLQWESTGEVFSDTFSSMLRVTTFSRVATLIICGCGFSFAMTSLSYLKQRRFNSIEWYALAAFAASGMLALCMANELITGFIALEIMSLAIYILVGKDRANLKASEAVLKYLILGAFSGGLCAMGIAFIYGAVQSTGFIEIDIYLDTHLFSRSPLLVAGSFLIFAAILFKIAAFPFHAWVVDVYDGASMPVTGFMATALKTAVFVFFTNILASSAELVAGWSTPLYWIAILTMFGGNLVAMGQNSIKRMLAASGIVHSGYLLVALVAFGTKEFTCNIIIYYLAAYAVATVGLFAALSYLSGEGEKRQSFDDFKGLARKRPYSAAAITIFLLSMAGIPPTAGFMGKLYIIVNALEGGFMLLAVLAVISSVFSLWYYLRLIVAMYFHTSEEEFMESGYGGLASVCTGILAVCVFAISLVPVL